MHRMSMRTVHKHAPWSTRTCTLRAVHSNEEKGPYEQVSKETPLQCAEHSTHLASRNLHEVRIEHSQNGLMANDTHRLTLSLYFNYH